MAISPIRAIVFDAVGTLLFPEPNAVEAYLEIGTRHGSKLSAEQIRARFGRFFSPEEQADRNSHWRTSEIRERQRWQNIVTGVLDDVEDDEACFTDLFEHFRRPASWQCVNGIGPLLSELQAQGLTLAIGSNFDSRLHDVLAGFPELQKLRHVLISSEVGYRKPAAEFFLAVAEQVQAAPKEILFVGDDAINDIRGASDLGMSTLLVDSTSTARTMRDGIDQHLTRRENA